MANRYHELTKETVEVSLSLSDALPLRPFVLHPLESGTFGLVAMLW